MEHDARYLSLRILIENSSTRKPLDTILNSFSPELDQLSKVDRALCNAIIYGTLRWQGHLDWLIQPFSDRDLEKLKKEIAYILRIAMFQIAFMDRIPVSAAVNSAVNHAKKVSHQGTAGFVNAVLRRASEGYKDIAPPDTQEPELNISVTQSMPIWVVRRWIVRFGVEKTEKLCRSINKIPPISIRTNTLKTDRDQLMKALSTLVEEMVPAIVSPVGISFVRPSTPLHEMEPFKSGHFQAQDEAAQLVTMMLNPLPGERILDACAGLGGKTGHAAQMMENRGVIVACDTDPGKLESLGREMKRLGVSIVNTMCSDLLKLQPADFSDDGSLLFDRVLVDAPCSGMGVMRRNPDSKWKRNKKDLARLAIRQEKMLLSAADLVKPGGKLLYAVCSCETRENDDVVENFLKQRSDFVLKSAFSDSDDSPPAIGESFSVKSLPGESEDEAAGANLISENRAGEYFRTYPDNLEMDGFFAALMERKVL